MIERYELNKWIDNFQIRMDDIQKAIKPESIHVIFKNIIRCDAST